ncbi:hypothetical protein IAG25_32705 [Caballeronia sp. EK]|uniref:hypothetical protein n=1 Tax=Caballeronia sp. EK TaxID=2767469 RepID=UPI001655AFC2|nr:hypothetical protein [Caballeronia sp. EK]MBC8641586.1 hypothetical protein [Caballeronia sp. EK]
MAMKFALFKSADGRIELRSADGRPLPKGDVDRRIVHILPQYLCPEDAIDFIGPDDVTLRVRSLALESRGVEVCPEGGIKIRQPYPNRRFMVAGSADIRVGWILPIPEGVSDFDLQFEWSFAPGTIEPESAYVARHRLEVVLSPGTGRTYTLDTSCWPTDRRGAVVPVDSKPYTPHSLSWLSDYRRARVSDARSWIEGDAEDGRDGAGVEFIERITLPSQTVSELWSITQFEDEQLHEVAQQTNIATNADLHERNACLVTPAQVFVKAITLARETPFGRGSEFAAKGAGVMGHCETHPAALELCRWWNTNAPVESTRCARLFNLWIRVRDDGEYWAGHEDAPNVPMEVLSEGANAHARVGGLVLVEFNKGSKDFSYDEGGFEVFDVTGRVVSGAGVSREAVESGEFDEGWYGLDALQSFPERFPGAWGEIVRAAAEERKEAADAPSQPRMRF